MKIYVRHPMHLSRDDDMQETIAVFFDPDEFFRDLAIEFIACGAGRCGRVLPDQEHAVQLCIDGARIRVGAYLFYVIDVTAATLTGAGQLTGIA